MLGITGTMPTTMRLKIRLASTRALLYHTVVTCYKLHELKRFHLVQQKISPIGVYTVR